MLASQCVPRFLRRLSAHPAQVNVTTPWQNRLCEEFELPAAAATATAFKVSVLRADLLGRVRALIRELLPSAGSIIERIAARLHMSARTLQRRLDDEGVRFHDLVEHTRQTLAMELIDDQSRDLGQIAFELGYSAVRAFARAFRRWTQLAPSDYRRSAL